MESYCDAIIVLRSYETKLKRVRWIKAQQAYSVIF